jgi:uncharacterized protein GlcG (DUF336 family)
VAKSSSSELLQQVDEAFETTEQKAEALQSVQASASAAIAEKQAELAAVQQTHGAYVEEAETAYRDARVALERLQGQLNERIGAAVNPRVIVRG